MEKYYSEISLPSSIKYLGLALQFVEYAAENIGFPREDITKIHLAAEEFIATVIDSAAASGEEGLFQVICKRIPTGIEIIINEKGLPYDLNQLPEFNPEESLENQTGAGLGLFLIKKMMDEFEIVNLGIEGRTAHLIKHLPQSKITDIIDEKSAVPFEEEKKVPARKNVEFTIRNIAESEAIEVSQCIYKAYGYSYLSEHVYYPERIIALNKSGHYITAVAATEQNEFAGTCQLTVEEGAAVASLGQAAVKPEFRNNRCLQYLTTYLIAEARKREIYGLFVEAVANHKFSQMGAHKAGMKDCSILLGYCPETMKFAKIGEVEGERTSIVQSYMKISETPAKTIYLPTHHKKILSEIYENIGVEIDVAIPPKEIHLPQKSVIKTKYLNTALSATITVVEAG
ncbi:ATP-binding protein, partial [bacterium]|nr:ATP-binding protein [bacterium]